MDNQQTAQDELYDQIIAEALEKAEINRQQGNDAASLNAKLEAVCEVSGLSLSEVQAIAERITAQKEQARLQKNQQQAKVAKKQAAQAQAQAIASSIQPKQMLVAYLLWWFLGMAGGHRIYLNHKGSGFTQLALFIVGLSTTIIFIGFLILAGLWIWWLFDAYFTQKMVIEENIKLQTQPNFVAKVQSENVDNQLAQLEKLHALYQKGALSKQEFEEKKSLLM